MEIQFLGTGAGMPSKLRNTSSLVLNLSAEGRGYWLFDCGEATQHQILHTSLKPRKIEKIFITHLHGDHIFGLPGLISSRSFLGGDEPLHIYGPPGLEQWLLTTLKLTNTHLNYSLAIHEVKDGTVLYEDAQFSVSCALLEHVVPSYGFKIEQKPLPGKLLIDKVNALGVPKGPMLKLLKEGQDVTLEDGRMIYSEEVTGESQPGFSVTILGDTKYSKASIELAMNSDVLVHEATFDQVTGTIADEYGHSTIQDAAKIAKNAHVKALIANHISARFLPSDIEQFKNEGCEVFETLYIAEDFRRFVWKDGAISPID